MFSHNLLDTAKNLVETARHHQITITTAESCTGGLVAGLLTSVPHVSEVFETGFVVYANDSKHRLLGVDPQIFRDHGAVSASCALAMARGAWARSGALLSVSVTGLAGPGGGSTEKPVGLVHFACVAGRHDREETPHQIRQFCQFGPRDRTSIRLKSVEVALDLLKKGLSKLLEPA